MHNEPLDRIAVAAEKLVRIHERNADLQIVLKLEKLGLKLDRILTMLGESKIREDQLALDLTALEAEVARNTTVDESANALIVGLIAKIEELKNSMVTEADKAALQGFIDTLKGSTDKLTESVSANTPAEDA